MRSRGARGHCPADVGFPRFLRFGRPRSSFSHGGIRRVGLAPRQLRPPSLSSFNDAKHGKSGAHAPAPAARPRRASFPRAPLARSRAAASAPEPAARPERRAEPPAVAPMLRTPSAAISSPRRAVRSSRPWGDFPRASEPADLGPGYGLGLDLGYGLSRSVVVGRLGSMQTLRKQRRLRDPPNANRRLHRIELRRSGHSFATTSCRACGSIPGCSPASATEPHDASNRPRAQPTTRASSGSAFALGGDYYPFEELRLRPLRGARHGRLRNTGPTEQSRKLGALHVRGRPATDSRRTGQVGARLALTRRPRCRAPCGARVLLAHAEDQELLHLLGRREIARQLRLGGDDLLRDLEIAARGGGRRGTP